MHRRHLHRLSLALALCAGPWIGDAIAQSPSAQDQLLVYCRDSARQVVTRVIAGQCRGEVVGAAEAQAARRARAEKLQRLIGGESEGMSDDPAPGAAADGAPAPTPPAAARRAVPRVPGTVRACPRENFDGNCDFDSLTRALAALRDGETLTMRAGPYRGGGVIGASGVTIKAEPGAHLTSHAVEDKAALVVRGNDVVIEGLEISGVVADSGNGAAIRLEGRNLTLRSVYFHANQMNFLSGGNVGTILIEDSRFADSRGSISQLGHSIYASANARGAPDLFVLRRSKVLRTGGRGHGVKSGARRTVIEDSVIAGLDGEYSRAIDVPMGGVLLIRRNVIEHGPRSENWDVIAIAMEKPHAEVRHESLIEKNLVIGDREKNVLISHRSPGTVTVRDNVLVGNFSLTASPRAQVADGGNTIFATRAQADIAQYPYLPERP